MEFKRLCINKFCEVWRIGRWKYIRYPDGRGWWKFIKAKP
jgi:hypothetical protein